jgi:hypothetical protein
VTEEGRKASGERGGKRDNRMQEGENGRTRLQRRRVQNGKMEQGNEAVYTKFKPSTASPTNQTWPSCYLI